MENKSNSSLGIISFVGSLIALIFLSIFPSQKYLLVALIIGEIVSIITLILGIVAVKKNAKKGLGIAGIVISVITILFGATAGLGLFMLSDIELSDQIYCPMVSDCVKNDDGTSTCNYSGLEVKCTTDKLKENQFKGE